MNMNPLDTQEPFAIELMNPNPTSSKTKDGPRYRVSFELHQDDWQAFMDGNTEGMILEGELRVVEVHTKRDLQLDRPKGGPISKDAAMLCQDDKANEFARNEGYDSFKDMIYGYCGITSRAELDHHRYAKNGYEALKNSFMQWANL